MTDLQQRLANAVEARLTNARNLLVYAQQTSLTLADPKWMGQSVPGWHTWPDVEAMAEWAVARCEADQRVLGRHRISYEMHPGPDGKRQHVCAGPCRRMWPCQDVRDLAVAYGIEVA